MTEAEWTIVKDPKAPPPHMEARLILPNSKSVDDLAFAVCGLIHLIADAYDLGEAGLFEAVCREFDGRGVRVRTMRYADDHADWSR